MTPIVRRARPEDARGIHEAHMASIQKVCSRDHSAQEIAAWGGRPYREDQRLNAIKNQHVWVVETDHGIAGFGHLLLESKQGEVCGHVMGLYLLPEVLGQGFGQKIMREIFKTARDAGATKLELESTLTAHRFYQGQGFQAKGEMTTVQLGGVAIRCIPMQLSLR